MLCTMHEMLHHTAAILISKYGHFSSMIRRISAHPASLLMAMWILSRWGPCMLLNMLKGALQMHGRACPTACSRYVFDANIVL